MSEANYIPIDALFDTSGFSPNKETDYRPMLHEAQVILGVDVMSGHEFLMYGRAALKMIAQQERKGKKGKFLRVMRIGMDQETDDLERMLALVEVVKGHHDYIGRGESGPSPIIKDLLGPGPMPSDN